MIVLGVVLLVIGFLTGLAILWTLGILLVLIGLVLAVVGGTSHAVGGRRHYY